MVNYNYLYLDWSNKKEWPKIFRESDFKKLTRVRHFFTRKCNIDIDVDVDEKFLDMLDNFIEYT